MYICTLLYQFPWILSIRLPIRYDGNEQPITYVDCHILAPKGFEFVSHITDRSGGSAAMINYGYLDIETGGLNLFLSYWEVSPGQKI